MTKAIELVTRIPFAGFYNTKWSDLVDSEENQWVEYELESDEEDREGSQPKAVRLDANELHDLLFRHTQYADGYREIAAQYVDGFNQAASDLIGVDLKLRYESMISPREYNFATDRLFAFIPLKVVKALFAKSKAEGHVRLAGAVRDSFTPRSGFIPHYTNDLGEWLEKPVSQWDHNEVCTLIEATLEACEDFHEDDFEWSIYYDMAESSCGYTAWSNAVDWPAFDAAREEARADKLADIEADLEDWERAEIEARADWRHGDAVPHGDQLPLL
jgi:hypothetical protein